MKLTEINIKPGEKENQDLAILSTLINECSNEYTKEGGVHYITFQSYLKEQICGIEEFKDKECELTITKLECGSVITDYNLVLGVEGSDPSGISNDKGADVVKDEIKNGKLGAFSVDKTTFNSTSKGKGSKPEPTKEPPQPEFNVYVIVTMEYTWKEFCGPVEGHFRERIAERSYDTNSEKLKDTDIFIVNSKRNCANPDDTKEGIDVWFVALGSDADEVTIQIGNDLKELLDSRQLRKLGNLFKDRVNITPLSS